MEGNRWAAMDMIGIARMLLNAEVLTPQQFTEALTVGMQNECDLLQAIVDLGMISSRDLAIYIGLEMDVPYMSLHDNEPDPQLLAQVPEALARGYRVVPVEDSDGELLLAAEYLTIVKDFDTIEFLLGKRITPAISTPEAIEQALQRHYPAVQANRARPD